MKVIHHIDGNPHNNEPSNLKFMDMRDGRDVDNPEPTMDFLNTMDTAPRDGTRILAMCFSKGYSPRAGKHIRTGTCVQEIWWGEGNWELWCGNDHTISTSKPEPIVWMPKPKQLDKLERMISDVR